MFFSFMMLLTRSFRALDLRFVPPLTPPPDIPPPGVPPPDRPPPDVPDPVISLDPLTAKDAFIVGPLLA